MNAIIFPKQELNERLFITLSQIMEELGITPEEAIFMFKWETTKECEFRYPNEMHTLIGFLEEDKAVLNIDYYTLEKLWYAFSETRCAQFLIVNEATYSDFKDFISKMSAEDARRIDYDGDYRDEPYEPWKWNDEGD